ncbi:serine/threonine-protein kinase CHEK2 [Geosmithia morbida]|uniref:Serine/threonine-protein kinase CHEK2 n=1 Tax=Geosmithia morbida TaxID=1094350 RepID=A0A9P4YXF3_9HYPO|nr:serine/threonine-protein kinase CHEK2 [Geosmithia morbida]KAF4123577.1 serine/threonine-protein kinase CHEK2 [Geosmithia morbida]
MPPRDDKTQLKRPLGSLPEDETESKKPRRSNRLANGVAAVKTPVSNKRHLPSPVTNPVDETAGPSTSKDKDDEVAVDRNAQGNVTPCKAEEQYELSQALSSPPQDTQPMSQFNDPNVTAEGEEEEDGNDEGIWGYLVTLDSRYGDKPLVLRKRNACPSLDQAELATEKKDDKSTPAALRDEEAYERTSTRRAPSGGYLIGRHPECDVVVNDQIISNRHCLIFAETKGTDTVVMLKDLSRNGTFVNEAIVGRNQCRERFTIDQCLAHPWINQTSTNVDDSTDGLVGGLAGLEVHRRGPVRERTLLSKPYSAQVAATVTGNENRTAKVSAENNEQDHIINASKEEGPAHNRAPAEFMEMGGKGDQALFENDDASIYPDRQQATKANQDKSAAAEKEAEDKGQRKIE